MDITQSFKASVMTVRLQRKAELAGKAKPATVPTKTGPIGPKDDFAKQAKEVCNKITSLRNVLIENRTAYMRIGQHLKSAAHMTDAQRDLIDRESEKFVTFYTQHLAKMRSDWKSAKRKPQERQHIDAVLDLLVSYLHSVEQIYLDQRSTVCNTNWKPIGCSSWRRTKRRYQCVRRAATVASWAGARSATMTAKPRSHLHKQMATTTSPPTMTGITTPGATGMKTRKATRWTITMARRARKPIRPINTNRVRANEAKPTDRI